MTNFILIFLCISLGMIISRKNIIPKDSYKGINAWLLYVALPALALRYVPEIKWEFSTLIPGVSPIIIWLGAFIFVSIYSKKAKLSKETKTAMIVTCGLGNTAFLGFPLISAFYGAENISYAIVFDQITFLLFSTLVVSLVLKTVSDEKVTIKFILKKVFLFPSFLATLFALIFSSFIDFSFMNEFLDKILSTLSPLALFSIGLQLKFGEWRAESKNLLVGLSYKLIIAPLIIFIFVMLTHSTGYFSKVIVFEASMPSHITASLLASQFELNPRLCNLMVGIGIIASFLTSTIWYFVCNNFM